MATPVIKPSGSATTDYIMLNQTMIDQCQATLSASPAFPQKTLVDVLGGLTQGVGVDFQIQANVISWSQMGMQTVLEVGDILRIQYFII